MPKHRKLQARSIRQIEETGTGQKQQQGQMASGLVINFKCQMCYKTFTSLENLSLHERRQCSQNLDENLTNSPEPNNLDVQNVTVIFLIPLEVQGDIVPH